MYGVHGSTRSIEVICSMECQLNRMYIQYSRALDVHTPYIQHHSGYNNPYSLLRIPAVSLHERSIDRGDVGTALMWRHAVPPAIFRRRTRHRIVSLACLGRLQPFSLNLSFQLLPQFVCLRSKILAWGCWLCCTCHSSDPKKAAAHTDMQPHNASLCDIFDNHCR